MDKVSITLRLEEEIHEELRRIAFEEKRSINNLINFVLEKYIEEQKNKGA